MRVMVRQIFRDKHKMASTMLPVAFDLILLLAIAAIDFLAYTAGLSTILW
ncbi:hypothetical protein [Azospirillum canadense]|nr:hypothetical protein [Azospirillum canadense]MCW2240873.1 hypothetical protein [Azospirillum canadense]